MVKARERVKVRTTVKAMRQGKLGKGRSGLTAAVSQACAQALSHLPSELFLSEKSQLELRHKKLVRAGVSAPWLSPWGRHTPWAPKAL